MNMQSLQVKSGSAGFSGRNVLPKINMWGLKHLPLPKEAAYSETMPGSLIDKQIPVSFFARRALGIKDGKGHKVVDVLQKALEYQEKHIKEKLERAHSFEKASDKEVYFSSVLWEANEACERYYENRKGIAGVTILGTLWMFGEMIRNPERPLWFSLGLTIGIALLGSSLLGIKSYMGNRVFAAGRLYMHVLSELNIIDFENIS